MRGAVVVAGEADDRVASAGGKVDGERAGLPRTPQHDPAKGNTTALVSPRSCSSIRGLRDVQEAASHAESQDTMGYDRDRGSLDRHATYIVATFLAGASR